MSRITRKNLSKKNPFYLPKERYYELKYFCLQAPTWEAAYRSLSTLSSRPADLKVFGEARGFADPTAKAAEGALYFSRRIDMIKKAAEEADAAIASYLYVAVTREFTYDQMKAKYPELPCGRSYWYDIYRKFFWILSRSRK